MFLTIENWVFLAFSFYVSTPRVFADTLCLCLNIDIGCLKWGLDSFLTNTYV